MSSTVVSSSSTPVLAQLASLATEKSSDKRRELLSSLADMFYAEPAQETATPSNVRLFADVVGRLLRDVDVEGRAEFAQRIAPDARLPREMVMSLARDNISVASPILSQSPVLTDSDLITLASDGDISHRLAISRRETVSEVVTDLLIEFGELEVAESLAGNAGAEVSDKGFAKLSDMAADSRSLGQKLSARADLPRHVGRNILPHLDPVHAAKLKRLLDAEDGRLGSVIDQAEREILADRAAARRRRLHVKAMMEEVEQGRRQLDAAREAILAVGRPTDIALALSSISNLPERQVTNAVIAVKFEPLALICRAIGVGTETYLAIDRARAASVNLPSGPSATMRELYAKIDADAARRTLRFVQVRNTVAPA